MSNERPIRDRNGRVIGRETVNGDRTTLRDHAGRVLGWHDAHDDTVHSHSGRVVGRGAALLGSLLRRPCTGK